MSDCVIKIEKAPIENGKVNLQVSAAVLGSAPYPKLSAVFSCSEENRIIPMEIVGFKDGIITAKATIDLAYIFYKPVGDKSMDVKFLFSDGANGYKLIEPAEKLTLPVAKRRAIKHFFSCSSKEKLKIIAGKFFSFLALPYLGRPVDENRVTFLSNRSDYLTGNIKSVFLEMTKVPNIEISVLCCKGGIKRNLKILFKFLKLYSTSKIVFVDDYYHMLSYVKKKDGVSIIQLWHACGALKTFGYSRLGKDSSLNQSSPNHRQYDYAVVSSKDVAYCYAEGFGISSEKILPLGSPRCDRFTDEAYKKYFYKKFYRQNPELADKKVILFAPTFRGGGQGNCYYPIEKFNADRLLSSLPEEYVIVCKMHPYLSERPKCSEKYKNRLIDLSDKYDINDILFVTDVLITDYSSVIFEASLLNIPMLFFAFDLDEYCKSRDFYCDYKSFVPGKIVTDTDEISSSILENDMKQELVEPFCKRNFDETAGKATQNVVRFACSLLQSENKKFGESQNVYLQNDHQPSAY